jgi:hypothetical protein
MGYNRKQRGGGMKLNHTTATNAWDSNVPGAQHTNSWATVLQKLLGCYVSGK